MWSVHACAHPRPHARATQHAARATPEVLQQRSLKKGLNAKQLMAADKAMVPEGTPADAVAE